VRRSSLPLVLLAGLVGLVLLVAPARHVLVRGITLLATGQLAGFQQYLQSLGLWAPAVSIALMVAESLFVPVPVTIVMVANGLVFGVWAGIVVSLAGGLAGASAAYTIGRLLGRGLVSRLLPAASLREADRLMARYGAWAIVLERWIPGVPGDPMSYAAGLTRIPVRTFLLLTVVGLLPANAVTAYLGAQVGGDVPLRYWVSGWTLVALAYLAWRIVRRRRRARRLDTVEPR
jgi:uncharacterized membrane protein YdjX (TVP38/TMEM64 family)